MKKRHTQRGGSLAEMALVMTALLTLMFGIIDFGRLIYSYEWLQNVSQRAVRWGIVRGTNCTVLDHCNVALNTHSSYVPTWIVGQDVGIVNPANLAANCAYGGSGVPGTLMVCYMNYTFHFMLPFMPQTALGPGIVLHAASRMYFTN
jgi:TadE-like protein